MRRIVQAAIGAVLAVVLAVSASTGSVAARKRPPKPSPSPSASASPTVTASPSPSVSPSPSAPPTPSPSEPTTTPPSPTGGLLDRKDLLYCAEVALWDANGQPALNALTIAGSVAKIQDARIPCIRVWVYDCFTGMTCGSDHHTGTIAETTFITIIQRILALGAVPFVKFPPVAKDTFGSPTAIDGTVFCPPWNADADADGVLDVDANVPFYQRIVKATRDAGATSVILESNNEMEYSCWALWRSQGATTNSGTPISSAGSENVSRRIGQHFAASMPFVKAYARGLGFTEVVVGGYLGVPGGPGWGQSCTPDAARPYGYACGYQPRWVSEFNDAVIAGYTAHGNNPDWVPDFESIHEYVHSPDNYPSAGWEGDDGVALAYLRNWRIQSAGIARAKWGAVGVNGDAIRWSISEWNAGSSDWSGWGVAGRPGQFYDRMFPMLRGDGNLDGTGTRWWDANVFGIAINSDSSSGGVYNVIRRDGTVNPWYDNFTAASTGDPLR